MKLMEMGGREEILLKGVSTITIILEILPERMATSSINPSLKRATTCRRWLNFIPITMINDS
jgi:hypothetical protein